MTRVDVLSQVTVARTLQFLFGLATKADSAVISEFHTARGRIKHTTILTARGNKLPKEKVNIETFVAIGTLTQIPYTHRCTMPTS